MNANDQHERFVSLLTRDTLALILAGGRGERLQHLTRWRAKPAVHFGGKFRLIDFPLSNCVNSGIRRIGVLTQYKAHSLINHIHQGWGFLRGHLGEFIEIIPAQQRVGDSWYAGTADAIFQNIDIIRSHKPAYVLILAGDHAYKMDYGPMIASHVDAGADVTVACLEVPIDTARSLGVMAINERNRILRFAEKPERPQAVPGRDDVALASLGIYVFAPDVLFDLLEADAGNNDSQHDFGKNIIPTAIEQLKANAYRFEDPVTGKQAYWRDVGTISSFWKANLELIEITPQLNLYDRTWPIWTHEPQLPPPKFVFDDSDRRGMAVDSMTSAGCVVSGALVRRSLLFNNVRVNSYSEVSESVILPDVEIGRHCRVRRAVVERWTKIPPHTVIGEDPEEDARRFHVIDDDGIVVVTPDMLERVPQRSDLRRPAMTMTRMGVDGPKR
jgi:glucose-1-phosphate adenylyltransferase